MYPILQKKGQGTIILCTTISLFQKTVISTLIVFFFNAEFMFLIHRYTGTYTCITHNLPKFFEPNQISGIPFRTLSNKEKQELATEILLCWKVSLPSKGIRVFLMVFPSDQESPASAGRGIPCTL